MNAQPATPAAPTASVTAQPTCATATGTITITAPTGAGMTYSTDGVTYTNTTGIFSGMAAGSYNLTAKNTSGCISSVTSVTVNAQPVRATGALSGSTSICNGASANLSIAATGPGTISGTLSDGTPFSGTAPAITVSVSPSSATVYTIATLTNGTCASIGADITGSATVTVTNPPSATISYSGSPFCFNTGTAAVSLAGTTGGSFSSLPTGSSINATTGAVDLSGSAPGVYTVTYTIAPSGACGTYTTTTPVVINPNTWTGGTSTVWSTASNWAGNGVPNTCPDFTILAGMPYDPILNSGIGTVQNLIINPGASLTISNATLEISGTIVNLSTFDVANGSIEMNGASSQVIPANVFQNNALKDLIISNTSAAGVSLGGALDIYGSLTYSGTGMKLNTNDTLTLKSTALNTAWVGDMTGNTITGKVTVEHYSAAHKAWRFLSVPTNTTQTIKQTWQEGATTMSSDPVPGFGTQVTSNRATWSADGFDLYSAGGPSLKTYDPNTNTWIGVASTNVTFPVPQTGYMTFVRGERNANAFNSIPTATVLRTKGNLYTGDQPAIAVAASKFAAIGNPYAATLDMRNISRTGIKDFFYLWDPKLSGAYGLGGYQTFSYDGSDYIITPGGGSFGDSGTVSNFIPNGQAFLVQATAAGGSLSFEEADKTGGGTQVSRPARAPGQQLRTTLYGVSSNGSTFVADGLLVNYDENYSSGIDEMDAIKSVNSNENLSVKTSGKLLVVERRHSYRAA